MLKCTAAIPAQLPYHPPAWSFLTHFGAQFPSLLCALLKPPPQSFGRDFRASVTELRQRGFAHLGLKEVKEIKACREQTPSLQGVSLGKAPGSSEQQEVCRDGAVSLACLAGLSAFQGHAALAAAGRRARKGAQSAGQHSHKPPGPTDPSPPGILTLTLLLKINDKRIAAFPTAQQWGFPRRSHSPASQP